ncbi:MAG: hypothetical protein HQL82_13985 [Magnetococcales bacterium]|nr:hypothetical protein [Magnetococcales bacterium]
MYGIGITALILAIVFLFLPVFGAMGTLLAALLSAAAAGPGRWFAAAALGIDLVNLLFFSPAWRLSALSSWSAGHSGPLFTWLGMILVQILAGLVLFLLDRRLGRMERWYRFRY